MIILARQLWLTLLTIALVAVCLVAGATIRSAADTPAPSHMQVSMPGDHGSFSDEPSGPLLDFDRLAPGTSIAAMMGVRNRSTGLADVSLQMVDPRVTTSCSNADVSCEPSAQFTHLLRFSVSVADAANGSYKHIWDGGVDDLTSGVQVARGLPNNRAAWVRLVAHFSRNAGNELQRHELHFGLRVRLDAGLLGTTTKSLGANDHPSGIRVVGLAVTGVQLELILTIALGLLGAGVALNTLGRRRQART